MAEIAKGIIDIEINTGGAASQLQALQTQINAFNLALNKSNKAQGTFASEYSRELQNAINKTGLFTAETTRLQTAASTLDKTLSKGKTSLGQFFSAKFNKNSAVAAETMALAAERAKRLQTQFIATSGAANGFQDALAVRPLAAFSSQAAVAAQKTQILSNMFKQGTTQLINFGKNVQWAGRQLMVGFTVPLTIFGAMAGKTFMELEKQGVAFKKVYGDIFTTPAELNKNLEAVKGLAAEYTKYGVAVKDTIGLAAQAAAAGRKDAELTDAVTQATRLATLGQMDQNAALETTISLQSAFRLSGKDLADTINFLNMVENQTVVSLQDIAVAIPRVAPVIQGLGGDVKDLTVFLAAMQEGGVDAAEGANALKSGLASLINPTKQANEMLSGMGINLQSIVEANKGDLMGTVRSFAEALQGLDQFSRQQALEQVFGKFQYAKLGALFENISREGSQAQQVIATMGYSTEQLGATADKELKTIEESFGVQLTGAVERFKLAIAPIGEIFVKLAIPLVNFATKIVESFNGLSDGQKRFAAIAAVIVGVVIPAVTMMAGLFLNLVGTLAKIGQGMALFGKGFITGGPVGAVKALTQSSKYLSLAEMDAAMAAQQLSGASKILNSTLIEQAITGNAAAAAINNLTRAYSAMAATQGAAGNLPTFGVAGAAGAAAKAGGSGGISIRRLRRNSGGGVPGSGNTDTVPAMLTPGEFVINKEATKNNLGLLEAINDGKTQGLNKGGVANEVQYLNRGALVSQARSILDIVKRGGMGSLDDFIKNIKDPKLKALLERYGSISKVGSASRNSSSQLINAAELSKIRLNADEMRKINPLFKGKGSRYQVKGTAGVYVGDIVDPAILKKYPDLVSNGKISRERLNGLLTEGKLPSDLMRAGAMASGAVHSTSTRQFLNALESSGQISKGEAKRISDIVESTYFNTIEKNPMLGDKTNPLWKISDDIIKKELSANKNAKEFWNDFSREIGANTNETRMAAGLSKRSGGSTSAGRIVLTNKDGISVIVGRLSGSIRENSLFAHTTTPTPFMERVGQIVQNKNKGGSIKNYASGGQVPGSGNTDTVPAMLTPGEFVVNKESTKKNYDLLTAINGSQKLNKGGMAGGVQYLGVGGMLANMAPMAAGMGASMLPMAMAPEMGMFGQIAASTAAFTVAQKITKASLMKFNKETLKAVDSTGQVGEGFKNLFPQLSKLSPNILKFAGPLSAAGAAIALVGFGAYKLNKQINDASKAGGKLAAAMYGTAESTNRIAEAFGRKTRAQEAIITATEKATEKATGEQVSEQSQQASSQFVQSDAGKALIQEIAFVEASGKDAAIALRNQLSQAIIAGAITAEEARSIAIEVGTALKNERLAVDVSAKIIQLMGPNGEKLTAQNILKIQAEISPKADLVAARNDAKSAFDDLNPLQKMFNNIFKAGSAGFENQYKLEEVINVNNSALSAQLNTIEFLNVAFKEGTITLENYKKALDDSKNITNSTLNTNAQALGFENNQALIATADIEAQKKKDSLLSFLWLESSALKSIESQKEQVKTMLEESGAYNKEAIDKIIKDFEEVGSTSWGKLLTGEWIPVDAEILLNFKTAGLTTEEIDELLFKLGVIESLPDITTVIDFKNPNPKSVEELYSTYEQLRSAAEKGPLTQDVLVKATVNGVSNGMDIFTSDVMSAINALPSSVSIPIIMTVAWDEETNKKLNAKEGTSAEQASTLNTALLAALKTGADKVGDGSGSTIGDGGKGEAEDLLKMLMERFKLQDMLIDKQAEGYNERVKQLNREIELEQRQVGLREKALEDLAKKEDAVNDAYNLRVDALDKVSESNSRIEEQEKSRISLASALASGDIAAAASITSEMQQQSAQYQIEDAKAALEKQRQVDLESLTVSINGKLMTRKGIESEIEQIQDRVYNKGLEIQGIQDTLIGFENRKLEVAKQREIVETRMYLMEQKKAINALKAKNNLTKEDQAALADYKASYNAFASFIGMPQLKNYGGSVARMANGGIAYKGSTEAPPAMRMAFGSTVPGRGMTDKVSALLTPGEFVVRKPVADKNRGFLEALNSQTFPGMGGRKSVPTNNFLDGIGSPRYSVPSSGVSNIPVANTNVVSTSSPMYNSTYNVNVNVSGTNASPDDIANVVMAKLSQQNRGNLRSNRY